MHKLIKRAGADYISESGANALGNVLEKIGFMIAKEAIDYAGHAGRKTVRKEDIDIATKKVLERAYLFFV